MAAKLRIAILDCASKDRDLLTFNRTEYKSTELLSIKLTGLAQILGADLGTSIFPLIDGKLPRTPEDFDALIIPGSKLDIDPEGRAQNPWMEGLISLIRETHDYGIPQLGICFGHQAIGAAFGSSIGRVPPPENVELGFVRVALTGDGRNDPLFARIPQVFDALSYHFRTVEPAPKGSRVLALGRERPILQSFRIGSTTWGVQFHPDYTQANLREMIGRRKESLGRITDLSHVRTDVHRRQDDKVMVNFIKQVAEIRYG